MTYARVFRSGSSQAVRLPKEDRFTAEQVEIFRQGSDIVLRERPGSAVAIFDALVGMSADFMVDGRGDRSPQERKTS